jgi:hypothetical protein
VSRGPFTDWALDVAFPLAVGAVLTVLGLITIFF